VNNPSEFGFNSFDLKLELDIQTAPFLIIFTLSPYPSFTLFKEPMHCCQDPHPSTPAAHLHVSSPASRKRFFISLGELSEQKIDIFGDLASPPVEADRGPQLVPVPRKFNESLGNVHVKHHHQRSEGDWLH
jgi:hypothetical protein